MALGTPQSYRGECKLPAGKLTAVTIRLQRGPGLSDQPSIGSCRINGDFFLEDDSGHSSLIGDLEQALLAMAPPVAERAVEGKLSGLIAAHPGSHLIGANAHTLTVAYIRALRLAGLQPADAAPPRRRPPRPSGFVRVQDLDSYRVDDLMDRWRRLPLRICVDTPRPPAEQAALDLALTEAVRDRVEPATLRIWNLSSPAVMIGRFQSLYSEVDTRQARRMGVRVVRRVTGGGAMFAWPSDVITYSLSLPSEFAHGLERSWTYRLNDLWLLEGLGHLGVESGWSGMNDIASPNGKIGGAAQRWLPAAGKRSGAILHHTMLSYRIDAGAMSRVLNVSPEKLSDKAVRSVQARVDPLASRTTLGRAQLTDALLANLMAMSPRATLAQLGSGVVSRGRELASERFAQEDWTTSIV
ncbi:biotin/lipoate A/B protein ligase family protein [Bifidobacterium actinocoloniiforme DSM 22766]|uniref:Biotin/lipoate A/B protein ligase family protein n=1 Tax=Bifidobacterium actinocoloniiforme DSM 22766 TaxID=1437605 RepID=A0A086YZE0_9BIFI|nr:lipoate--protein ligase family protein [Bifidobacterium actinocoloniiforme]KFI39640.1 biotin/lipoate A/B protein ligase family protein [Bifidobacterium actinocoloniiforme DSM 22766]